VTAATASGAIGVVWSLLTNLAGAVRSKGRGRIISLKAFQ
jgi:hypothetical protein